MSPPPIHLHLLTASRVRVDTGLELGLRDRGVFVSFASIDMVIVYLGKTCNYAKVMQPVRMTYKVATHDDEISGIRKNTWARILRRSSTKAEKKCKQLTYDSVVACVEVEEFASLLRWLRLPWSGKRYGAGRT